MNKDTGNRTKPGVDALFMSSNFVKEYRMTKAELRGLREVVVAYMTAHDVSVESAVMDLIETDSRFSGGFECLEIAIIMGTTTSDIKHVEAKALKKLSNPNFGGRELRTIFSGTDSEYKSDF